MTTQSSIENIKNLDMSSHLKCNQTYNPCIYGAVNIPIEGDGSDDEVVLICENNAEVPQRVVGDILYGRKLNSSASHIGLIPFIRTVNESGGYEHVNSPIPISNLNMDRIRGKWVVCDYNVKTWSAIQIWNTSGLSHITRVLRVHFVSTISGLSSFINNIKAIPTANVSNLNDWSDGIVSSRVPVSDGQTGGSGSAGSGNQYVSLTVNGVTYKVLHDGTI